MTMRAATVNGQNLSVNSLTSAGSVTGSSGSFVNAVSGGGVYLGRQSPTVSASVPTNIFGNYVDATAGAVVMTLPTAASSIGIVYCFKKIDASANTITVQGNGAETIDGTNTKVLSAQYAAILVQSTGTQWFIISAS